MNTEYAIIHFVPVLTLPLSFFSLLSSPPSPNALQNTGINSPLYHWQALPIFHRAYAIIQNTCIPSCPHLWQPLPIFHRAYAIILENANSSLHRTLCVSERFDPDRAGNISTSTIRLDTLTQESGFLFDGKIRIRVKIVGY